ncbi:MAG TPA: hypothetical protein PKD17_15115, partial [Cellvibrionaceae bacterium]|nr:hypothetical protein [Cellvibrionaceae bacterium]
MRITLDLLNIWPTNSVLKCGGDLAKHIWRKNWSLSAVNKDYLAKEPLKNVGGEALARRIW